MQKKYNLLLASTLALATQMAEGQTLVDATRLGSNNIVGTARYRAMGGAFGALGGDPSAMNDNPAGLGIYRGTSEVSFTPNLSFSQAESDGTRKATNDKTDFSYSNLAYVLSVKTPGGQHLFNVNFGFGINHSAGTNRRYSTVLDNPRTSFGDYLAGLTNDALDISGNWMNQSAALGTTDWYNSKMPLLGLMAYDVYALDNRVDEFNNNLGGVVSYDQAYNLPAYQRLRVREKSRNDQYTLSTAFNWEDLIYAGLSLTIADFNTTTKSEMSEDYQQNYGNNTDYTEYENRQEIRGTGVGLKMGLLVKVLPQWRIGLAVHTPTWTEMHETYSGAMRTNVPNSTWAYSGVYDYSYRYYSPWEYQVSTAYIFGQNAILSFEWNARDFDKMKYYGLRDEMDSHNTYTAVNRRIKEYNKAQHTFKGGLEVRATPRLSLRLGYAHVTSPYEDDFRFASEELYNGSTSGMGMMFQTSTRPNFAILDTQHYISGGIGWRANRWYFDLTCTNHITNEYVANTPTVKYWETKADYVDLRTRVLNYDLTVGYKF